METSKLRNEHKKTATGKPVAAFLHRISIVRGTEMLDDGAGTPRRETEVLPPTEGEPFLPHDGGRNIARHVGAELCQSEVLVRLHVPAFLHETQGVHLTNS